MAGSSVKDCLARYPDHADDLAPLLELVSTLQTTPKPRLSQRAFDAGRAMLKENTRRATQIAETRKAPSVDPLQQTMLVQHRLLQRPPHFRQNGVPAHNIYKTPSRYTLSQAMLTPQERSSAIRHRPILLPRTDRSFDQQTSRRRYAYPVLATVIVALLVLGGTTWLRQIVLSPQSAVFNKIQSSQEPPRIVTLPAENLQNNTNTLDAAITVVTDTPSATSTSVPATAAPIIVATNTHDIVNSIRALVTATPVLRATPHLRPTPIPTETKRPPRPATPTSTVTELPTNTPFPVITRVMSIDSNNKSNRDEERDKKTTDPGAEQNSAEPNEREEKTEVSGAALDETGAQVTSAVQSATLQSTEASGETDSESTVVDEVPSANMTIPFPMPTPTLVATAPTANALPLPTTQPVATAAILLPSVEPTTIDTVQLPPESKPTVEPTVPSVTTQPTEQNTPVATSQPVAATEEPHSPTRTIDPNESGETVVATVIPVVSPRPTATADQSNHQEDEEQVAEDQDSNDSLADDPVRNEQGDEEQENDGQGDDGENNNGQEGDGGDTPAEDGGSVGPAPTAPHTSEPTATSLARTARQTATPVPLGP